MKKHSMATLVSVTFLGIALGVVFIGATYAADEGASSSACIKCHTDLEKMDTYGAASAGGAAAIAG
jgi:nitrate/TMAO reductase-like tetraheme cytochrome c subunit